MREVIRYAWGSSYLGKFLVGVSQQGVIACEFDFQPSGSEIDLKERFPEANLVADQEGLADVVDKLLAGSRSQPSMPICPSTFAVCPTS